MSWDWADKTARRLSSQGLIQTPLEDRADWSPVRRTDSLLTGQTGICLVLGAVDTGKTTLAAALAGRLAEKQPVGIIDADIGQSHIGPPTTVGWAFIDKPHVDFSRLTASGISFVGDVTPVGHLLQLTSAIVQGVRQVSRVAELIVIDTPGFIRGPAAAALWWTVQQILRPSLILAVQHSDELSGILSGLQGFDLQLERIKSPPQIPSKSPPDRQSYRKRQFISYFRDARFYNISLSDIAVQPARNLKRESFINRVVALRNEKGIDMAIGVITGWQQDGIMVVKAPLLDPPNADQIRCLVIGDTTIDIPG